MRKSVIQVKNISKEYKISHEFKAAPGTLTFKDSIRGIARKPIELITGHKLKKENFWALKDINFEVEQGEVLGIIGKNGSGKSTLLKILSRIVEPTTGEIRMQGRVASLLEVGTGFHPELTGRENIYFNGSILGMKKKEIEAKFDDIVAFSEVEKFLDTPVKFYSSGMYVRLAFAVAAHLEPDILIIDEVLAVGDAAFQKKCLGKMKEVAGEGRTVLFVSHSMASIQRLCSRVLMLEKGEILNSGNVQSVIESYNTVNYNLNNVGSIWKYKNGLPSNQYIKVNSARLVSNKNTTIVKPILSSQSISLEIDLKVLKEHNDLSVGYALYNSEGDSLYWTYQTDMPGSSPLKKGKNKIVSNIPVEYLNQGDYTIVVIGGIHNQEWLYSPEDSPIRLNFKIVIDEAKKSRLNTNIRPTVMAPIIEWRITT